jgi:hypothetical protein
LTIADVSNIFEDAASGHPGPRAAQVVVQAAQGGGGRPHCHVDAEKGSKYDVMAPEV